MMQGLLQNLRYTLRTLRESLGLTTTILLTIALGIGATTAIFTVDYATLLAPSPYPHPDRLVNIWSKIQGHRNFVSTRGPHRLEAEKHGIRAVGDRRTR